jgi:hypothetical protein
MSCIFTLFVYFSINLRSQLSIKILKGVKPLEEQYFRLEDGVFIYFVINIPIAELTKVADIKQLTKILVHDPK